MNSKKHFAKMQKVDSMPYRSLLIEQNIKGGYKMLIEVETYYKCKDLIIRWLS